MTKLDSYAVTSDDQEAPCRVEVLLPAGFDATRRYPALFILPVNAGSGGVWGDSVAEAVKADLANRFGVICVFPTFARTPWYADHPTDPHIRQESYFLNAVLPLIDAHYPVRERWLVGFSKSGWGAWSLLLRHPERFDRAAAWDAPLQTLHPDRYEMEPVFATQANFEAYRIDPLLERRRELLQGRPRLVLMGWGNFHDETVDTHQRLEALGIPHVYRDGPRREHRWDSGWLLEAVELLATAIPDHSSSVIP